MNLSQHSREMSRWLSFYKLLTFTSVAGFVAASSPTPTLSKMHVSADHRLVDTRGRARIFHGLNRVQKAYPWYPPTLLDEHHLDALQSWGFNVVRLGMMWSGVETSAFSANQTYLNIMETIIDSLGKRGIYVILDMHQDALSSKFGSYDGAPLWLVNSFPQPKHAYPYPFKTKPTNWEENYLTSACGTAFDDLYNNQSRAQDHLEFFWRIVAKRYGSKANVLGYELINEPWPGNVDSNPLLFIPGKAGSEHLQPLYDKLAQAINTVDKNTMIFYEPVTWGMILHGSSLGSGFTHVPGGNTFRSRSVFSFHYYCWFAGSYDKNPFPKWLRDLCDNLFFPDVVSTVYEDIKDTGGGMFLTEFGLCNANAPKDSTSYQECLSVLKNSDLASLSWTYWDSSFYFPNGSVNTENVKLFARPYATVIEGTPLMSSFDTANKAFALEFIPKANSNSTSYIYVPPIQYPNGVQAQATGCSVAIDQTNFVKVHCPSTNKNPVIVEVRPKI